MSVAAKLLRFGAYALLGFFTTGALALSVTDHLGRTVELPDNPKRIVTTNIYPFASVAAVCAENAGNIVGIHPLSMQAAKTGLLGKVRPEILKADTSFMQGNSLNVETLMRLEPDVVFVNSGDKPLVAALENAGINALAVSTGKWNYNVEETLANWVSLLDAVFPGSSKQKILASYSAKYRDMIRERTANLAPEKRRRVLFIVRHDGRRIVTSGEKFFGQYWCDAVGAVNVAEKIKAKTANAVVDAEQVYAWNPDAIILTNFSKATPADIIEGRLDDYSGISAVETKSVYKMPLGLYRTFTPSPESPVTTLWLAKTLYPALFADIDPAAEAVAYYRDVFGIEISLDDARKIFGSNSAN